MGLFWGKADAARQAETPKRKFRGIIIFSGCSKKRGVSEASEIQAEAVWRIQLRFSRSGSAAAVLGGGDADSGRAESGFFGR